MIFIKKKKHKQLKACRRACQRIYAAMTTIAEDENGNASPFRWDKVHKEIFDALAEAGYGRQKVVGIDEWEYPLPWPVKRREEA